ncbi:hypothetical protein G6F49_002167 [Rhizopus delemar]|nr:hypothetical protein G6F49_002167 [Rhizopus delemar]KAG1588792.1 hypothetical protein G6F48_005036 [Rhizopus delemar]
MYKTKNQINKQPSLELKTVTLPRNPLSILSRRHLSAFKLKRRSIKNNKNGIPRIPIQHKENDYSTFTQDQQPSTEDQTSVTTNQENLQVDCSSTGESYNNDPSDRRSTSSYSSSSTRLSKEPTIAQSELGKTVPDISTKSTKASMAEEINNNEERPTDSVHESTNTTDHNLHEQLRLRLGSEFANDQDLWFLEQGRTRNVNKRPRTESSILCVEDACKKIRKLHNKGFHRQHDGIEIHNKIWRNSFTPITRISSDNSGHLQQIQFEADSDDDSAVQDDCLDVTLKASRSVSVSAAPTVPNEEDDVRHDHHTAVLSAFDAMGESEKEQEKKLLVAELGDLDPIAIVDQEGKEYNLLANKKIINTIIELNQIPLVFSLPKKRKFVDEEESQPDQPSTSIRNIILDSYYAHYEKFNSTKNNIPESSLPHVNTRYENVEVHAINDDNAKELILGTKTMSVLFTSCSRLDLNEYPNFSQNPSFYKKKQKEDLSSIARN